MAFGSVVIGAGAGNKPWFNTNGNIAGLGFSVASVAAHVSPDVGFMPLRSESVYSEVSGGVQIFALWEGNGTGGVGSGAIDPPGSADAASGRTGFTLAIAKAMRAATTYIVGIQQSSGGVGFMRTTSGSTTLWNSGFGAVSSWAGTGRFTVNYNTIPSAPLNLQAVPGANPGEIDLSWDLPSSTGGLAIDGYKIERSINNFASIENTTNTGNTSRTRTVTGLTPGQEYKFKVSARNAVSASHAGTPHSVRSNIATATAKSAGAKRWDGDSFEGTPIKGAESAVFGEVGLKYYDLATTSWKDFA